MRKSLLVIATLAVLLNACASKSIISEKPKSLSEVSQALDAANAAAIKAKEAAALQAKANEEAKAMALAESNKTNVSSNDASPTQKIIYFDTNSFIIKNEFKDVLTSHHKYILSTKNSVLLQGHTDQRGTSEYNLALGQKRAEAFKNGLVILGTDAKLIETVSFGKEKPAVDQENEDAYSKNRRSLIIYK
jgi:peptidoglycan-associated lipoprotein